LDRVTREGWAVIRGNAEFYLLDYNTPRAPAEWKDTMLFPLHPRLHQQLNGRWLTSIATWPDTLSLRFPDAPPIRVVHGSPRSVRELIYPISTDAEIEDMLVDVEETTVVAGHTHLAMDRQVGRRHILNPGAVGNPVDGMPSGSYMLLDGDERGWRPTFRRAPFDREPLLQECVRQGYADECGVIGQLVMQDFETARPGLLTFVCWREICCPEAPLTQELLEEFNKVNPWNYTPLAYHVNLPA
jgi:diadenosine tetraphosphatase ApaH/serine/threonine PP2A family protein phosphatase